MCGITGYYGKEAIVKTRHMLTTLAGRGNEAAGLAWEDQGALHIKIATNPDTLTHSTNASHLALGHVLHAMVDCVPQPLQRSEHGGTLIVNCEIYNWQELARDHDILARNDADLLCALLDEHETLDEHAIANVCNRLDGVYAFAYVRNGHLFLARDLLGVKPLFIATQGATLAFASEGKALRKAGCGEPREVFPRTIIHLDTNTGAHSELQRPFFGEGHDPRSSSYSESLHQTLVHAIEKRVPNEPFALFLGGGVDSAVLAHALAAHKPRCYVVGTEASGDVRAAQTLCAQLNLPLTIVPLDEETLARVLPLVHETIEDGNTVKAAVGVVTWIASEAAARDGLRCAFSGFGADEVFAATERARASTDARREVISALRKLHERDLFRDDSITMRHGIELRLPYLDHSVIHWSLAHSTLLTSERDKAPLRETATEFGVSHAAAQAPRRSPQYGSGVMRLLASMRERGTAGYGARTANERGAHRRLVTLLSGGKDSVLALHIMHAMGYEISCAITIESDNPDSYLYHTPNVSLAKLQAQAMQLPFLTARTHGEPERELDALERTLREAQQQYGVQGVVTGAIRSHYQRERIERLADSLSLTVFSPLWQTDQLEELRRLVREGYRVVFTKVAAEGLDHSWLGEELSPRRIDTLAKLQKTSGIQPAGEGGEYESLVLDAPLFHSHLVIGRTEVIKDGLAGTLVIHDARLVPKH